jgi:hypothetical protein
MVIRRATFIVASALLMPFLVSSAWGQALAGLKVAGPDVLDNSISGQWGGHTSSYLIEGERGLFWSATAHTPYAPQTVALVGQQPQGDSALRPLTYRIRFTSVDVESCNQPQMIRTPDGFLHIFVGVTHEKTQDYSPGRIRYLRSKHPEDISVLVDNTHLIPKRPYKDLHLRMNVGVSPDGNRMALVALAISNKGRVPFNTPVVFIGERDGADFVFRKPVRYTEPMAFFYPQVAATNDGIVLVGQIWDNPEHVTTGLVHLDWDGAVIHRERLPAGGAGTYISYDLRPRDADDWRRLILYYNRQSKNRSACFHEFWEYDTQAKAIRLLRSIPVEYIVANPGKWVPVDGGSSVFLNNPSMSTMHVWTGNVLGPGHIDHDPLPKTDVFERGYLASSYLMTPNVLQGSVRKPGHRYFVSDCHNLDKEPDAPGPCSLLLWRLDF